MSSNGTNNEQGSSTKLRPKIIVDVDAGGDDASALLLLIAAQRSQIIDILAISCVHGNSTLNNVCINVVRFLESLECFDIPVFRGAEEPLIPHNDSTNAASQQFFGTDGFGDLYLIETPNLELVQPENGIEALNRIAASTQNKGKVTLLCLGPLTNIALAMRTYPEFAKNLKEMYIMGGNYTGKGNVTSAAEFNFYRDPEAAHIVLSSAVCPVKLLPWETSLKTEISLDWRFNVLGGVSNRCMDLLNAMDKKVYGNSHFPVWYPCDAIVAAIYLQPDIIITSHNCHITVELNGQRTRGQVVVDHLGTNDSNVNLIEDVNCTSLMELLLWAAKFPRTSF